MHTSFNQHYFNRTFPPHPRRRDKRVQMPNMPVKRTKTIPIPKSGEVDPTPEDVHFAPQMGQTVRWNCKIGNSLNRDIAKEFLRHLSQPVTLKQASNFTADSPSGLRMNFGIVLNHSAARYKALNASAELVEHTNVLDGCSAFLNRAGGTMSAATTDTQTRIRFDDTGVLGQTTGTWKNVCPALYDGFGVTTFADLAALVTKKNMNHIWTGLESNNWASVITDIKTQVTGARAGGSGAQLIDNSFIPRESAIGLKQAATTDEMNLTPLMVKRQNVKLNWINRGVNAVYVDVVVYAMKENVDIPDADLATKGTVDTWMNTPVGSIVTTTANRFNAWKAAQDTKTKVDSSETSFTEFNSDAYLLDSHITTHGASAKNSFMHSPAMRFMPSFKNVRKNHVNEYLEGIEGEHHDNYREVKRHRILIQPNCTVDETYYCGGFEVNLEKQAAEANGTMAKTETGKYRTLGVPGATLVFMCSVVGENIPVKGNTSGTENIKGMQAAASSVYCEYESTTTIAPFAPLHSSLTLHNASIDIQPTTGYEEDLQLPLAQHVQVRGTVKTDEVA